MSRSTILAVLMHLVWACLALWGQPVVTITLSPMASPGAAQAGTTVVTVLGSGFPGGTIASTDVTVTGTPATGSGEPAFSVQASAVQAVFRGSQRISFGIQVSVNAPALYQISVRGKTSGANGIPFASGNTAALTVNPAAQISSVTPGLGNAGVSLQAAITGLYTNFLQGATLANFGPGVSVGGAPAGQPGPVTVTSPTTAIAQLAISATAASGVQTVTVATGVQQESLTGAFSVGPPVTVIGVDTTQSFGIAAGLSGFDDEHLITGVEYFDPKFMSAVQPLKPGWIRFPAGTPSMAYDWQAGHENQAWITSLLPQVTQFASEAMTLGQKLSQATGGFYLSDFATFVNTLGVPAIICFNGFSDTNADSAGKMALAAQAAGLHVIEWELSNEPYLFPKIFPTPASYAAAMEGPYFDGILSAAPDATIGLFYQGLFAGARNATWDTGMANYSPHYWSGVSTHVYPITNQNISTADEELTLNGFLAHGTAEYFNSYLLPLVGADTPVYISEVNDDPFGTMPFEAYLYNGVFLAEFVARMSTIPNVKAVGVVALYLSNNFQLGMIRAANDFQNYLVTQVDKNPNFSTNTAKDPNTQFSFYYSAPGLAMAVANQAINNSTSIWPTTVTGSPMVPILGYDGNPVPAVYAQGYAGDNGKHYLLITNKSATAVPVGIEVDGNLLPDTVTLSYVSNASDTAENTATAQDNVQIVTMVSGNPISVGPYSVTRVEW